MVDRIQRHLEAIYGMTCEARAESFVVDTEAAVQLGGTGRSEEELLVCEQEGTLELALYFAPGLLERVRAFETQPLARLLDEGLDAYCQLAEGVSHFLYLVHTAAHGRRVSLLELETQAEVDKFAVCLLHRWGEGEGRWARELLERLFVRVRYRPGLSAAERWRYEEANRLSRAFCGRLLAHASHRRLDRLLTDLRYAYRLGAEAKLRHLGQAS